SSRSDLKLQINEAKSAVASVFGRKFLGYALCVAKASVVVAALQEVHAIALDDVHAPVLLRQSA
ncbi:MAG: hypothetical protein EBW52_12850, partial [Betaproteobacteria bacterium]|nr:hypothetical protein [Betaproteobacteria bacterium]NCV62245.1 hypothetical protein [Betaproteobacteria bacterium]